MKRIGSSSHVTKGLEVNNYGNIVYPNTIILLLMHTGGHFGRDKTDLFTILLEEHDRGDQILCSHL